MITIALDESGNFEKAFNGNDIKLIAGIVYEGKDFKSEELRLKSFLKELSKEVNNKFQMGIEDPYPNILHSTDNIKNYELSKYIIDQVMGYLKNSSNYYTTAYVKTQDTLLQTEVACNNIQSNIVDDKVASNLYERMMFRTVLDNIYYNPQFKDKKNINLNIATRSLPISRNKSEYKVYKELGYNSRPLDNNRDIFYLTDVKTFKGALSTKLNDSNNYDYKNYSLNVESILYNNEKESSAFLYLADIICDYVKRCIKDYNNQSINPLRDVKKKIVEATCCKFIGFYDDEVDVIWNDIVDKYNNEDLVGVLEKIYDLEKIDSEAARYYNINWIKGLKENITDIFNEKKVAIYIEEAKYFVSKREELDYEKGLWILTELEDIIRKLSIRNKEVYLYDIAYELVGAYNHRGDVKTALDYYNICEDYKESGISLEKHISLINRVSVIYSNIFEYDKAIEKLKSLEPILDIMNDANDIIGGEFGMTKVRSNYIINKGKVYSGLGQYYSFKKDYKSANEYFAKALEIFTANNDSFNKSITKTYLGHLYIETKNIVGYKKISNELFGSDSLKEQYNNIVNKGASEKFNLYLYVKGLYVFYKDQLPIAVIRELKNFDKVKEKLSLDSHPGSLILKYVTLLLYSVPQYKKDAKNVFQNNINCIKESEFTIDIINIISKLQIRNIIENKSLDLYSKENKSLLKELQQNYKTIDEVIDGTFEAFSKEIMNLVTYNYN